MMPCCLFRSSVGSNRLVVRLETVPCPSNLELNALASFPCPLPIDQEAHYFSLLVALSTVFQFLQKTCIKCAHSLGLRNLTTLLKEFSILYNGGLNLHHLHSACYCRLRSASNCVVTKHKLVSRGYYSSHQNILRESGPILSIICSHKTAASSLAATYTFSKADKLK